MANRITGIRRYNGSAYEDLVPFGVDGANVTMASLLNLEEDLKIGGDSSTTIEPLYDLETGEEIGTTITSKYYEMGNTNVVYSIVTQIVLEASTNTTTVDNVTTVTERTTVTSVLYQGDLSSVIKTKTTNIDTITTTETVNGETVSTETINITEKLS